MNATVKIITGTGGRIDEVRLLADLDESGQSVRYSQDGGKTVLCWKDGVTMTRTGDYSLQMCFRQGETTLASTGIGGSSGEFPLTTERCLVEEKDGRIKIMLRYALGDARHKETFNVRISIEKKDQEE